MKRLICLLLALLVPCVSLAEKEVRLPDSRYTVDVPEYMKDSVPGAGGVQSWYCDILEMDCISYRKADAQAMGMSGTLRETAEERAAAGAETELREVNGIEMICFRTRDEADGAPCIGYIFEDGDRMIEVDFWYANEEAAALTAAIISSIR